MRVDTTRTDVRNAFAYLELTNENIYQCPVCHCRDGRIVGTEAGRRWIDSHFHRYVDILIQCNGCKARQRITLGEQIPHGQTILTMQEEQ